MRQKQLNLLLPVLLGVAVWLWGQNYLFRELWFDEALTILNFALLPDISTIYHSYVIPNNQIVYTILLHGWLKLIPPGIGLDVWARLLSMLLAWGVIGLIYGEFKGRCGKWNLALVLLALIISPPFLLYATAVRGYMCSMLGVALTLICARRFALAEHWLWGVGYFLAAFLTLGTIPSNLVALAGVGMFVLPNLGRQFWRQGRFWWLLVAPFFAGLLFYLPIGRLFLGVTQLGEGWSSAEGVLLALATAVIGVFGVTGLGALIAIRRPKKFFSSWRFIATILIFLLPIPAVLLWSVAPFPRVFFPLFLLWALVIAHGMRYWGAAFHRKPVGIYSVIFVAVVFWGGLMQLPEVKKQMSEFCGSAGNDDFFYPYYLRPGYEPGALMRRLAKQPEAVQFNRLYFSFRADPWPLMFYYQLNSDVVADFRFDGPRGPVRELLSPCVVILNREEKTSSITERFGGELTLLWHQGYHEVYQWAK